MPQAADLRIMALAHVRAKEGSEQAVIRELIRDERPSREEGCLEYSVWQDPKDVRSFTVMGIWTDRDAFEQHMRLNADAVNVASRVMDGGFEVVILSPAHRS